MMLPSDSLGGVGRSAPGKVLVTFFFSHLDRATIDLAALSNNKETTFTTAVFGRASSPISAGYRLVGKRYDLLPGKAPAIRGLHAVTPIRRLGTPLGIRNTR